jgi:hypothetical protein
VDFNVALADRRPITQCFDDVMTAFVHSLRDLGHTAANTSASDTDRINLVFGYYLTKDRFPERSIVYQLEPVCDSTLSHGGQVPVEDLRRHIVWDYSRYNVERLRRLGVEAHYVPIGHHPRLERVVPVAEQDIDVLFYGVGTPRRLAILSALRRAGLTVDHVNGTFGTALDPIIARAKVVVNLHALSEYRVLETARVGYLMSNRKAVVAEINHTDDTDDLAAGIVAAPYSQLVDACVELVGNHTARTALEAAGYDVIRRRRTVDILAGVLDTAAAIDPLAGAWGPRY